MTAPRAATWLKPKYLLFAFVGLMFAYVLRHNESFLLNSNDPAWQHYQPFKWWLLPHGLAGACALILVPMQFSDRLRQRYTKLHRVSGRFYVVGALIAAPLGAYIEYFEERLGHTRSFSMAALTHGTLWALTTLIAFTFILKRQIPQHRQWMMRSVFVGPGVFIIVRAILGITGLEKLGPAAVETSVWMCVAFSIPLADVAVYWGDLWRARVASKAKTVTAAQLPVAS